MLVTYQALARLALDEFKDVVTGTIFVGGMPASPNKLRLTLIDGSFLDVWLSADGDYAYHWEQLLTTFTMAMKVRLSKAICVPLQKLPCVRCSDLSAGN